MGRQILSLIIAWAITCWMAIGICGTVLGDPAFGLVLGTIASTGHVACPFVPAVIYDGLEKILGPE